MSATNNLVLISPSDLKEIVANAVLEQLQNYLPKHKEPFADYPDFVTKKQAKTMLSCSLTTINNWTTDGRLKVSKNGRVIRYAKSDVLQLLQQNPKHKRV